jgi:small GTP-binding protein
MIWDCAKGISVRELGNQQHVVNSLSWSPELLASVAKDNSILLWNLGQAQPAAVLSGHSSFVFAVAWSPDGQHLASAGTGNEIRIWTAAGTLLKVLEGHTNTVSCLSFSFDGRALASVSYDDTVRLWRCDTWEIVAMLSALHAGDSNWQKVAFHPSLPILATLDKKDRVVHLWELDLEALLAAPPAISSLHHVTAKVVLVGNSGVGKTGLGWRLSHHEFKEHASTHGQQFWLMDELRTRRVDGTECEAVLWDLAGQQDYRLIHGLFLDDAELALVLFDAADREEPLAGVEFWLKTLANRRQPPCPVILVGARLDRGAPNLTEEEIAAYCSAHAIDGGHVLTSAMTAEGVEELLARMKSWIPWHEMPATVTTSTFRRIKEYVLSLKESPGKTVLRDRSALRADLRAIDRDWQFSDDEMMTALGHLAKYGYVRVLRTASGAETILLQPELLNNLAASFVLEARRNPKGLGALDEDGMRSGGYQFPELASLAQEERDVLLDATMLLFVEHNLCFREGHGRTTFLIFPELINRKRPQLGADEDMVEDVSYSVEGAVENVYAALVVLLGYTSVFTRTDQWQNQAQYELGQGDVCGFRQIAERGGELELVLYYGPKTGQPTRLLFQGLFEKFLTSRRVSVTRYPPLTCPKCAYRQERAEVVRRTVERLGFLFCSNCGKKIRLAKTGEAVGALPDERQVVELQQATAFARTRFEAALLQLRSFIATQGQPAAPPSCFVSYAWGSPEQESWVERQLATDLRNAGVEVILDRWDNAAFGGSIPRFISRIQGSQTVLVVGSPRYREKYENRRPEAGRPEAGFVVAAEIDLIDQRMIGSEAAKSSVLPILIEGDEAASLPPLLQARVWGDFRRPETYFGSLFDLILTLFKIPFGHQAVADLRQTLRPATLFESLTTRPPRS